MSIRRNVNKKNAKKDANISAAISKVQELKAQKAEEAELKQAQKYKRYQQHYFTSQM